MGFGHRVYRAEDPRARHLRERSRVLSERMGQPHWFQILTYVEEVAMVPYRSRGIFVNVDFFAGSIYYLLGFPEDIFIPIFALGRIPGWTLQCVEQYEDIFSSGPCWSTPAKWTWSISPSNKEGNLLAAYDTRRGPQGPPLFVFKLRHACSQTTLKN